MQSFKTIFHPSLFNNYKAVDNPQKKAVLVGDFFEEATANLLHLKRLNLDPFAEACPDCTNLDRTLYVESKACNLLKGKGVAIAEHQVKYYKDIKEFHFPSIYDGKPVFDIDVKYCLWFYSINKMSTEKVETIRDRLTNSIDSCIVVDLSFIESLFNDFDKKVLKRKFSIDLILKKLDTYIESNREIEVYGHRTNKFRFIQG